MFKVAFLGLLPKRAGLLGAREEASGCGTGAEDTGSAAEGGTAGKEGAFHCKSSRHKAEWNRRAEGTGDAVGASPSPAQTAANGLVRSNLSTLGSEPSSPTRKKPLFLVQRIN